MKKSTLTDATAAEIITQMQLYYKANHKAICGAVLYDKRWFAEEYACYRYVTDALGCDPHIKGLATHPDHFGIVFQGWSGTANRQGIEKKEVPVWLDHLLDPEGPFKEILPYLYHTETKEILVDKGFVVKDALSCNAGLLWTFLQATRLMYENPMRMAPFMHGVKKGLDKPMALFCALVLKPCSENLESTWNVGNQAHGEPLGHCGYTLADPFLNGKLKPCDTHKTGRSYHCFGETVMTYDYRSYNSLAKPFDAWVTEFNKVREKVIAKAA